MGVQRISLVFYVAVLERAKELDVWRCSFTAGQTQGYRSAAYEGDITVGKEGTQRLVAVWELTLRVSVVRQGNLLWLLVWFSSLVILW